MHYLERKKKRNDRKIYYNYCKQSNTAQLTFSILKRIFKLLYNDRNHLKEEKQNQKGKEKCISVFRVPITMNQEDSSLPVNYF